MSISTEHWARLHAEAVARPRGFEAPIVGMLRHINEYVSLAEEQYGEPWRDYVLGEAIGRMIDAVRDLLNGPIGRLDAGTVDAVCCEYARRIGWNPDTGKWEG